MAKWPKDADHLYIIGDATPFGWAQSTSKTDNSTRIWPFTQKMKNEGNGVFTYIGPALGSNAVSYTHLDVYKRQRIFRVTFNSTFSF